MKFGKLTLVVLLISTLVLSGCQNPPAPTEAPAVEEPTAVPAAPSEAPAETQAEAPAEAVELTIESWRTDDQTVWEDVILPAFMKENPNIKVKFAPTPNTEYSSVLATKIAAGTAGDLIMVEPFDWRVPMYEAGNLANLNDLEAMQYFTDVAKGAWSAPNGDLFGVPLASVLHGFIYNADIFDELSLEVPKTMDEFHAVLDKIKADGKYVPLAMGTADEFVANVIGFELIGQGYWKGEEGRVGLVDGTKKFSDPEFVAAFEELAKWADYMPEGYQSIKYSDMQNLFETGQAAVYPAGSWEIGIFERAIGDSFKFAAFPPPLVTPTSEPYFCDHMDQGMAMNAATKHPEEAKVFLNWLGTPEFATLWNANMPGFFALSTHKVTIEDPLATQFLSWRDTYKSTFRIAYKTISASEVFNTDNELTHIAVLVMNREMTPQEAGDYLEKGLASWYEPHQKK